MIKNQEGFAPLVMLVGALVATTIFGGSFFLTRNSQLLNTSHKVKTDSSQIEDISDPILKKHFLAFSNQKQYRVKTTSSQNKGFMILDVNKDNGLNYHSFENDGNTIVSESIYVNNNLYQKGITDNTWIKQKDLQETEDTINNLYNNLFTYTNLGTQTCGKLTCFIYEESSDTQTKRVFLFDDKDFLLQKEEFIFGEYKTTNEYSYTPVSIPQPFPVKEKNNEIGLRPTKEDVIKIEQTLVKNQNNSDSQTEDLKSD